MTTPHSDWRGATVIRGAEDYHRGDHFSLMRLAYEFKFGNVPDGVCFDIAISPDKAIGAEIILGTLHREDGWFMKVGGRGNMWKWRTIAR